jgi:hypothetical protein
MILSFEPGLKTMKKIYTSIFIFFSILVMADILNNDGKAGRTGSPGENDCTGCHTSFAVNSGPGSIIISSPNLTNWEYVPGQTYQIDVTVAQAGMPLFGFGFEALRTSNNSNGGTLSIINSTETQLKTVTVQGNSRTNVVHKENGGLSNDSHTFSFNWTAPATNIGNVMFYTAGNAANNQNDSLGDYIYKSTQLVTPFVSGMDELLNERGLIAFPNPAIDYVALIAASDNPVLSLRLFDLNGRITFQQDWNSPVRNIKIKKPDDGSGIYLAVCKTAKGIKLLKIVFRESR